MPKENSNENKLKLNRRDNPFLNSKLYPVSGVISSGFLDVYLQDFCGMREGLYLSDGTSMDQINSEVTGLLNEIGEIIRSSTDNLNSNNMKGLKEIYKALQATMDLRLQQIHDSVEQTDENMKAFEKMKKKLKQTVKPNLIQNIHGYFMDKVNAAIEKYNKNSYNLTNVFVDFSEVVCLDKIKGVIATGNSSLKTSDANMLKNYSYDLFRYFETDEHIKTNGIFMLYLRLLINIKGRPFGAIICTDDKSYEYFNAIEVQDILNDDNDDDYYDDYFDEDDE